jgi:hypothetical protein
VWLELLKKYALTLTSENEKEFASHGKFSEN